MTTPPPEPNLTRLVVEVHTRDDGSRSAGVSFLVNVQQTLLPDFDAAAHDAVLSVLHHRGMLPVGPILVTTETFDPAELGVGTREEPIARTFDELNIKVHATNGNLVKVSADVELGLSL